MRVELNSPEEGHAWWRSGLAFSAERETAMSQDIILAVDYHDANCVIRQLDRCAGTESLCKVPTGPQALARVVAQAAAATRPRGGCVVWLQESTTGWPRVKQLVEGQAEFLVANVLQMPLPPKAQRRKTDKVDTARLAREYLNGEQRCATGSTVIWRTRRGAIAPASGRSVVCDGSSNSNCLPPTAW
jgi:hypothetical protein